MPARVLVDADAVDEAVERLGGVGLADDATVEDAGHGVKEPPGGHAGLAQLGERRFPPLAVDLGDALDVEHPRPVQRQDDVVGGLRRQRGRAVAGELPLLPVADLGEWLDDCGDQARQVVLGPRRVLAADHVVGHQRQVVAAEHVAAEADADRERLVVRVAQRDRVLVAAVGRAEHHHPEVAHPVRRHPVVFLGHRVAVEAQGMPRHVDDPVVGNGHVGGGRRGRDDVAQRRVVDRVGPAVQHERHGVPPRKNARSFTAHGGAHSASPRAMNHRRRRAALCVHSTTARRDAARGDCALPCRCGSVDAEVQKNGATVQPGRWLDRMRGVWRGAYHIYRGAGALYLSIFE